MTPQIILIVMSVYFAMLILISFWTGRKNDNDTFFTGNRNNHWMLIAFGMIGSSLSGVTFLSIPGTVGKEGMFYMQVALGYVLGYLIIAYVLLPIYYKYQLTSIYEYLKIRFGMTTYRTGAFYFLVSRLIGSSLRLYLVAHILQIFLFGVYGYPFWVSVFVSITLIWLYTFKGGIKTIIWTDTLQTLFMLVSLGMAIYLILNAMDLSMLDMLEKGQAKGYSRWFQTSDFLASNYWLKSVLGGMFITLAMTGVDQDMMQKNLSCKNIKDAQKNMVSFSLVLVVVNVFFLILGVALFTYIDTFPEIKAMWESKGGKSDALFATISMQSGLGLTLGIVFLLGLIAAAYSSADSALAALTTSFCVDFLNIEKYESSKQIWLRKSTHIGMSFLTFVAVLIFNEIDSDTVVGSLFKIAGYTYGPLLGLFFFGIMSKRTINDAIPVWITLFMMVFIYVLDTQVFGDPKCYRFGFELLGVNAILTMLLLALFSKSKK
jgi:SSS family transporter